jgi:hypothetical protein
MVYHNEPRRDLAQQQLMAALATRFAHPGTVFIPDTVRYTVAGYDSARPDPTESTLQDRWESAVAQAEALTGITMAAIGQFPGTDYSTVRERLSRASGPGASRVSRALAGPDMTLLTSREVFTEISYTDPATASAYPPDLKFGDLLIRSTETTHPLTPPRDVQPGDTAILSTDGGRGEAIPLTLRRDGRT